MEPRARKLLSITNYLSVTWTQCYLNRSKRPEDAKIPALSWDWVIYHEDCNGPVFRRAGFKT